MITNLPNNQEFENLAKNCLVQAFDLVFQTDKVIFDIGEKSLKEDVWKYSQGKLNTAVVLIHQAIESFMKASVCLTSPLLLLEGRRKDWPVLPDQEDKDFNEFYTTPAEALLRTYAATVKSPLSPEIVAHIEAMRTLRNQIVHGISRTELNPKKLIDSILDTFLFFLGKDEWWQALLDEFVNHPFGNHEAYPFGIELARFAERLDYVEAVIGKAKFAKQFTQNTRARRYICPFCKTLWLHEVDDNYPYRWALLDNSKTDEPVVHCVNCRIESPVTRESCYYTNCKGSVRFYGPSTDEIFCLTCGEQQYSGTQAEDEAAEKKEAEQLRKRLLGLP
ncbi:hypothetical protein [uncultured Hymenobacter sp.]|uniref:hypothetical protein n=1 Tax=uncultured Hymenobacter sp. TaxID=170016 RepID=UPI0035C9778B